MLTYEIASVVTFPRNDITLLSAFLKQLFQFVFGSRISRYGRFSCLLESEIITKIGAGFFQYPFGLRFAAVVICAGIIKRTVETAMQINAARMALRLPADKKILCNFFFTFMANVHECEDISCVG